MKILHVVPGLNEGCNGIAVAAKLFAGQQFKLGNEVDFVETRDFISSSFTLDFRLFDEIWVHSMWLPITILACLKALRTDKKLVRMTHGNLDPVRLRYHGWKKRLAAPVERWLLRKAEKVIATCEAERQWILAFEPRVKAVEVVDLKRFFRLDETKAKSEVEQRNLHVLYLGRLHPLKGVRYLQQAVAELNASSSTSTSFLHLRTVSDHFGAQLERDWEWCDVLCLPTLSENFGLVIAEALERGKTVITTDGAPAWDCGGERLIYIRGFRDGSDRERVESLKRALCSV